VPRAVVYGKGQARWKAAIGWGGWSRPQMSLFPSLSEQLGKRIPLLLVPLPVGGISCKAGATTAQPQKGWSALSQCELGPWGCAADLAVSGAAAAGAVATTRLGTGISVAWAPSCCPSVPLVGGVAFGRNVICLYPTSPAQCNACARQHLGPAAGGPHHVPAGRHGCAGPLDSLECSGRPQLLAALGPPVQMQAAAVVC
jgi:hypothetical protein